MLSDEQLSLNTSLEDNKDLISDSKKRNELGVILISFLNCFKLSCLVLLQITIPDLSLFAESTYIVTAQLNLSDSHHYQENFKPTLKAFLDLNFISSQIYEIRRNSSLLVL